jgi:hypothetical protein
MATSLTNRDLSKLKWIKVISDDSGWAYTRDRLKVMPQSFDYNDVTVFPLGFRTEKAAKIESGDQLALIQKGKLTHVVEVMDRQPYQGGGWYHRVCHILWWNPETDDWKNLRPQRELLGFDPTLMDGEIHTIETLKKFGERWNDNGHMEGFRAFLEAHL